MKQRVCGAGRKRKELEDRAEGSISQKSLALLATGHQDNTPLCFIPPYTPLLYSKTGVYRVIHFFLFLL